MSKTRKTIQAKNLASYDVYTEDTTPNSVYFQVTNLPQYFTGGRNSFFVGGSSVLQNGSSIQIEILDSKNQPVFYNPVPKYIQGDTILASPWMYFGTGL